MVRNAGKIPRTITACTGELAENHFLDSPSLSFTLWIYLAVRCPGRRKRTSKMALLQDPEKVVRFHAFPLGLSVGAASDGTGSWQHGCGVRQLYLAAVRISADHLEEFGRLAAGDTNGHGHAATLFKHGYMPALLIK